MVAQHMCRGKSTPGRVDRQGARQERRQIVKLTRHQADIVAPGAWLTTLVALACFARPVLAGGAVVATLVIGIYYAARDADGIHHD